MTTTDANGIVRYTTSDPVSPLHTLLNLGMQSVSDAVTSLVPSDSGWITTGIVFESGWSAGPMSGWSSFAYRIRDGYVTLNGTLLKGSWSASEAALTLPAAARPGRQVSMPDNASVTPAGVLLLDRAGSAATGIHIVYPLG